MKLSIITPTFNAGEVIDQAIKSILQQSFPGIEHIIIDGGSSDNTPEIVKKYPHLTYLSEPDNGIFHAMNKGIKMAKGQWVYFMGADDRLCRDILKQLFCKGLDDFDCVYGNIKNSGNGKIYDGKFSLKKMLLQNICHQAIFTKRKVLLEQGGFNQKYKIAGDWDMNIRIFANKNYSIKYINQTIAIYNENGFSSKNQDIPFLLDKIDLFRKLLNKEYTDPFFESSYLNEAIVQMKFGSIKKAIKAGMLHAKKNNKYLPLAYTLLAFYKWRTLNPRTTK